MPKFPKLSSIPRPPVPAFLKNYENKAKGYTYVNIVIQVYQLYAFWFDISQFELYFLYGLIYVAFVIAPMALGFFLLIAVHKRQLKRIGIWWACEIALLVLNINLFIVGIYGISWKTILNLLLHSALRIYGLKIIYDYMIDLDIEGCDYPINSVNVTTPKSEMVNVQLDDQWSGEEKL